MWIVRIALSRPYTFIVLAILILVLSPVVILRTPTDIFPNIDIPVQGGIQFVRAAGRLQDRISGRRARTSTVNVSA